MFAVTNLILRCDQGVKREGGYLGDRISPRENWNKDVFLEKGVFNLNLRMAWLTLAHGARFAAGRARPLLRGAVSVRGFTFGALHGRHRQVQCPRQPPK